MLKQLTAAALLAFGMATSLMAGDNVPRPEYPRPQLERQDWVNLNGVWTYALDLNHIGLKKAILRVKASRDVFLCLSPRRASCPA